MGLDELRASLETSARKAGIRRGEGGRLAGGRKRKEGSASANGTGRDGTGGAAGGGKEWVRVCLAPPDGTVISHIHKSD